MAADAGEAESEEEIEIWQHTEGFVDISKEQDGSLLKKILKEGTDFREGDERPGHENDVMIHYEAFLHADGTKFDSSRDRAFKQHQFQIGLGEVVRAWDVGVRTMRRQEKCILRAKPNYGYGKAGSPALCTKKCVKIPPDATLDYEVEMFAWQEHEYEPGDLESDAKRSAHALKHKELGNEAIKDKDWRKAGAAYSTGIGFVEFNATAGKGGYIGAASKLNAKDKTLYVALLNNSALCALKLGESAATVKLCDKALAIEEWNIKLWYRRGQAHLDIGEWVLVIEGADRILALDPGHLEAQKMKQSATKKLEASKKQQRAEYGKMFGGGALSQDRQQGSEQGAA